MFEVFDLGFSKYTLSHELGGVVGVIEGSRCP